MGSVSVRPAHHVLPGSVSHPPGAAEDLGPRAPAVAGARVLYARNAGTRLGTAELAKLPEHRQAALQVLQQRFQPARGIQTLADLLSPRAAHLPAADAFEARAERL